MAEPALAIPLTTREEYFALEQETDLRHEFADGVAYAMVGGTGTHNLISMNLAAAFHAATRGGPCEVFQQGMKLRIAHNEAESFFYPDVMICCDPSDRPADGDLWRERPTLLAEVLSPSTERNDKAEKLIRYQTIASLDTYLIVHSIRSECWLHTRTAGWRRQIFDLNEPLALPGFDLTLTFETLYDGVF